MKQMWDKKEIETLIEQHGGSGGVWGQITGTLSNQTDLKDALDAKQDTIDSSHKLSASLVDGLATVATTGDYDDLLNKPTIPTVIPNDGKTIVVNDNKLETAIGGWVEEGQPTIDSVETQYDGEEYYHSFESTPDILYTLLEFAVNDPLPGCKIQVSEDGNTWVDIATDLYIDSKSSDSVVVKDTVESDNYITITDSYASIQLYDWASSEFEQYPYARLYVYIAGESVYHKIDGRFIPIDGTTITLDNQNKLKGFSGSYNDLSNKPTIPTNADYVDRTTSQTIAGIKIFNSDVIVNRPTGESQKALYFGHSTNRNGFVNILAYGDSYRDTYIDQIGVFNDTTTMTKNFCPYQNAGNFDFNLGGYGYGGSTIYWKNLYLNGNITDGTKSVSVANIATLNTTQTITGDKTFTSGVVIEDTASLPLDILCDSDESPAIRIRDTQNIAYTRIYPNPNNTGAGIYLPASNGTLALTSDISTAISGQTKETWTFTLSDGTTTTKTIVLG